MTFWKSQTFKALQNHWYKRLEQKGFVDAEKVIGDDLVLKQTATAVYKDAHEVARKGKDAYFYIMAQHMHEENFKDDIDRYIMLWHVEGKKIKDICKYLEWLGTDRCRNTICFTIRKYEMKWGIRKYTPKQLNKKVI